MGGEDTLIRLFGINERGSFFRKAAPIINLIF